MRAFYRYIRVEKGGKMADEEKQEADDGEGWYDTVLTDLMFPGVRHEFRFPASRLEHEPELIRQTWNLYASAVVKPVRGEHAGRLYGVRKYGELFSDDRGSWRWEALCRDLFWLRYMENIDAPCISRAQTKICGPCWTDNNKKPP